MVRRDQTELCHLPPQNPEPDRTTSDPTCQKALIPQAETNFSRPLSAITRIDNRKREQNSLPIASNETYQDCIGQQDAHEDAGRRTPQALKSSRQTRRRSAKAQNVHRSARPRLMVKDHHGQLAVLSQSSFNSAHRMPRIHEAIRNTMNAPQPPLRVGVPHARRTGYRRRR